MRHSFAWSAVALCAVLFILAGQYAPTTPPIHDQLMSSDATTIEYMPAAPDSAKLRVIAPLVVHRIAPAETTLWRRYIQTWANTSTPFETTYTRDEDLLRVIANAFPHLAPSVARMRTLVEKTDSACVPDFKPCTVPDRAPAASTHQACHSTPPASEGWTCTFESRAAGSLPPRAPLFVWRCVRGS